MTQPTANNPWTNYYQAQNGRPPRPLLLAAIDRFGATTGLQAIDLGCGEGTDTLALLRQGWRVLAIDEQPEAIARLNAQLPAALRGQLQTQTVAFAEVMLPVVNLIYAGFSLPFCQPDHFAALWAKIVSALPSGGRFAGQLFGERDSWSNNPQMTFLTSAATQERLRPFVIEAFTEIDEDGQAVTGPKHWHYFEVIAQKQ